MSDRVIDVLAEKEDPGTAVVLTKNERIRLTHYAIGILAEMAEKSDAIAKPLLLREEVPPSVAKALYSHVGNELKSLIQSYYGIHTEDALAAVDDVILDFAEPEQKKVPEFMPLEEHIEEAMRVKSRGELNFDTILETLKKGRIRYFIALFSAYMEQAPELVYDALTQESGKKLAVICRAYGTMKGDFSTIYMMTQRIRTKDRIMDQQDLFRALRYFDRVKPDAARQVMDLY